MNILAIDTSCDETAAAVTCDLNVISNVIWSQASLHAQFGGVMPSLAQRQHEERIDWVIQKALDKSGMSLSKDIDAIAVTIGPGLSIALGVGINRAKKLAILHKKPLIPVNHIESHLLSPMAKPISTGQKQTKSTKDIDSLFPCMGLVLSGGTTLICLIKNIGEYEVLAETQDDALGEALDKGARLLGLGYPGGAILEKFARMGEYSKFSLTIPLIGDKVKNRFSYSGLKTAFVRLFNTQQKPSKQDLYDLAASYQDSAFRHITYVLDYQINNSGYKIQSLFLGGGVANNIELKARLRKTCKKYGIQLHTPYSKKLNGDNAAMIGICAYLKNKDNTNLADKYKNIKEIDRNPRLSI